MTNALVQCNQLLRTAHPVYGAHSVWPFSRSQLRVIAIGRYYL